MLDFGAGAGPPRRHEAARDFRGAFSRVCGVDVIEAVLDNPLLHEARVLGPDGAIPYPDAHFDGGWCDFVFEHLDDPARSLGEIARVLRPGARLVFRTVNRRHPWSVAARCLPAAASAWLADRLGHAPSGAGATFETRWRLNSRGQIVRHAEAAGMSLQTLVTAESPPVYYRLFAPAWYLGVGVERVMNRFEVFAPWRVTLMGVLVRDA